MIQVVLPRNLQILAGLGKVVEVRVEGPATQRAVLDQLEAAYPALLGTMRDAQTKRRRPMIRFFACEEDHSDDLPDDPLPPEVASGKEPLLIIGAIAGGSMNETPRRSRGQWRAGCSGCGGYGCASFFVVITLGLLLSLFNTAIGMGASVRVPFTSSTNITLAGSVGKKDKAPDALPGYVHGKLGGNQNFINGTQTLTIWVAEGTVIFVVGQQEAAPLIDLHLEAR